jgi:two-component sensor histidine kinase
MADRDEMVRRQEALARFGEAALRSDDVQEILTEACRLVAEALDVNFAKVLEIDRQTNEALVRAGYGWDAGVVGRVRLPLGERSSEARAINTARPLITRNIAEEERFEFPDFMRDHGVVALVNVPVFVPGGEPYGLLQVDSREPRDFGDEDIAFLATYATILGPVIDRLHKVSDLRQARDRNAVLLRELQHRVKNDLAVVQSIIRLRAKGASEEARNELRIVGERIETLRLLQDQLYSRPDVDRVAIRPYVQELLGNLAAWHQGAAGSVELRVDVAKLEVQPSVAAALGLILNEFTTNSFKYGFDGRPGILTVGLSPSSDDKLVLRIADNGVGFAKQDATARRGTGMTLIEGLARQLGGRTNWSSEGGVRLEVEFPLDGGSDDGATVALE